MSVINPRRIDRVFDIPEAVQIEEQKLGVCVARIDVFAQSWVSECVDRRQPEDAVYPCNHAVHLAASGTNECGQRGTREGEERREEESDLRHRLRIEIDQASSKIVSKLSHLEEQRLTISEIQKGDRHQCLVCLECEEDEINKRRRFSHL